MIHDERWRLANTCSTAKLLCIDPRHNNAQHVFPFLLDKLLTTKYPLGVVLMELAVQLGRRNATLRADWLPRLQNEEADALTNSDFRHFDMSRRIEVDLDKLGFILMNSLFSVGDAYVAELSDLKSKEKARKISNVSDPDPKRKKSEALRETQPWV